MKEIRRSARSVVFALARCALAVAFGLALRAMAGVFALARCAMAVVFALALRAMAVVFALALRAMAVVFALALRASDDARRVSAAVELRNVTKSYGPVRALVGVSCRFDAGAVSVVSGPNGSGKSTLLAIVGLITHPTSGKVDHGALGRGRAAVRRTVGWLGHESLCYPDLSGRQNIEIGARLHGCDAAEAFARAALRFELGAFVDRPVRTYSRGQRQRVALARALVHAPGLLLLDEPTTGLDQAGVGVLRGVMREEADRGAIVVVVTHDSGFGETVGDAFVALERGRVVKPS